MGTATNREMVEVYEAHAAKWFECARTMAKDNPEAVASVLDYAQHCATMAEMFRQDALEAEFEQGY
jgi:hypothetical protein